MKKIISTVLLATAVATPALAADQYYVSLDTGTYSMAKTTYASPGALDIIGGYRFADNMALEVGYMIVGDTTLQYTNGSTIGKQSVLHASGVFSFPINDSFDFFGKLGFNSLSGKITGTGIYASTNSSATTTNLTYGIGGQYKFTPQIAARLQYEALGKAKASSTDTGSDVTRASVGVVYSF